MDDNDLYLHIRRKIVTFSQQAKNTTNHISTHECMQIKPQSFKQFQVKARKGLKNGAVYEIDYNAKGIPENVIPVLDTFIAGKMPKVHWNNSHKSVRRRKVDSSRPAHRHSTSH